VLHAVGQLFRRGRMPDASQLTLALEAPPRSAGELLDRLRGLGLGEIRHCVLTRNRTVMVSVREGELRVHEGYLAAPEAVHRAIVAFVGARRRATRRAAQEVILAWEVPVEPGPPRRTRPHPDDTVLAARLQTEHARLNAAYFGGALRTVPVQVSRRMKSRLGHYAPGASAEIAIGRRHIRRHGWREALDTLLHEMVHQWQDETGQPIDHGRAFRRKAREVGITPRSRRMVERKE
jgi:SprT-like family